MSINEAGIVKIGKQFASHRIKPTKKTLLQKIKQKIQDKITKPDRGDVIYMNTEEAPVNVMGAGGVNGLGTATGGIQGFDPILGATPRERKKKFKEFRRKALGEEKKITTKARGNGFHDVLVDGEKHPHVEIVNGSGGVSGYGRNVYGVHYSRLNKTRWIGSLQQTKRHIEKALNESRPSTVRLAKKQGTGKAEQWIKKVYSKLQPHPFNRDEYIMGFSPEEFAVIKLSPSKFGKETDVVYVDWFQAYPLGAGVGQKAMKILQKMAAEDDISLALFPWAKGKISQKSLVKFYKKQGFTTGKRGSTMTWQPAKQGLAESGPLSGKPKKLKPLTPKKLEPLKYRLERINKRGAGSPGAVKIKDWLADKKRRKEEYKKEREERMKNRERRDENT